MNRAAPTATSIWVRMPAFFDFRSRSYPKSPPSNAAIKRRIVILVSVARSGISENSATTVVQISCNILCSASQLLFSRFSPLALGHVARSQCEIAVEVGLGLRDRDLERTHKIAAFHMPLPEQSELDELEAAFHAPPQLFPRFSHPALPTRTCERLLCPHSYLTYIETIVERDR